MPGILDKKIFVMAHYVSVVKHDNILKLWSYKQTVKALQWEQVYFIQTVHFIMSLNTDIVRWYPSGFRLVMQ
jgi:hypothetical protein